MTFSNKKEILITTENGKCLNCETRDWKIKTVPLRHLCSPSSFNDPHGWGYKGPNQVFLVFP